MPSYSVVILSQGQENQLTKCLQSLPREVTPKILYLSSIPLGTQLNQFLAQIDSDWVLLIDEIVELPENYVTLSLPFLEDQRVQVLGGPDYPQKELASFGKARAIVLSSPFCTGATFARHRSIGKKLVVSDEEQLSHRAFWIKRESVMAKVQFMNADLFLKAFFLQRCKEEGVGVFYHPKVFVMTSGAKNFSELWSESMKAGFYRSSLIRQKLASGSEIFWLPAVFVLMHFLIFIEVNTFYSLARLYAGLILTVSIGLSIKQKRGGLFPLVAVMHYVIVVGYGLGFLKERITQLVGKSKKEL